MSNIDNDIYEIYKKSKSYALPSHISTKVTSSTLAKETLRFLGTMIESYQPKKVFEFGSGLSTLFLFEILNTKTSPSSSPNSGFQLFTVDHSAFYLEKTRSLIGPTDKVSFYYCPIRLFLFHWKAFATYNNSAIRDLHPDMQLDLILIDGPPSRRYGREAVLYRIAPFITKRTIILLDDSNRPSEQEALLNWNKVWPDGFDVVHFPELKKGFSVLQIRNPENITRSPFSFYEILQSWKKTSVQLISKVKNQVP